MENLLFALLGWVSGLFSNVVLEWNQNRRQVGALRKALRFELSSFRYRMANIVFMLSIRTGTLTGETAAWILTEYEAYSGTDRNSGVVDAMRAVVDHPEEAPAVVAKHAAQASHRSLALKKYPTPALDAAITHLTLFKVTEQESILELRTLISNFDALVDEAWQFFQMTFDSSLSGENRAKIDSNVDTAYRQAAGLCRRLAERAAQVLAAG